MGFAQIVDSLKPIIYYCTIDSTYQPAMFAKVNSIDAKPLLVGLHTWDADYTSESGKIYYNLAKSKGWNYIFPNLRGPNNNPKSTDSEYVFKDAEDAVRQLVIFLK
ncbi:MAG TPA: hypothetical protein VFF33_13240 [Ignavibacteriaceae bacterium]|nr:hypothetical protein [Ignavibacteriaceae bacterium]